MAVSISQLQVNENLMPREVPEWIGAKSDTPVPTRVTLRVFEAQDRKCKSCKRSIVGKLCPPQTDHIKAIINDGKNRESNLQILCRECHAEKTADDVAEKSMVNRVKEKHYGLSKPKCRPMPGTRASGIRKRMNGRVERW